VPQPIGSLCFRKAQRQGFFPVLALLLPALLVLTSCGGGSTSTPPPTPTITASCAATSVTVNGTVQCTATITNLSSTLVNWQVNSIAGGNTTVGKIDTNGLYTAPTAVPTPKDIVTITAIAQAQTTLTANASGIQIKPATAISAINCTGSTTTPGLTVTSGMGLACTATDSSGHPISVFWQVNTITGGNATIGTINVQGNYLAPLIPAAGGTVTITAVSQAVSTNTMSVTVNVTFGNAVLQGPFVFSTSGRVISGNGFFARAGSLNMGGDGTLIGNIEDYVSQTGGAKQLTFTGIYSIGPDGRGTMQFCENISTACTPAAAKAFFRIVVVSPQQAQIIEFSQPNTTAALEVGSGEMDSQDASVFGSGGLAGIYSFSFSGVSSVGTPQSDVGEFSANGHNTISAGSAITPGRIDINNGGPQTLSASTYSFGGNGQGTARIITSAGTSVFSFYAVSSSRAKFIETDPSAIVVGDAFAQQISSCNWGDNALSGTIAFETAGTKSGVGITNLVSFMADGKGVVTAESIDQNSGGTVTTPGSPLGGSYSIDPCGRGTLNIPATSPVHQYVFYMTSVGSALIQEVTSGTVAHGTMVQPLAGPGPFTAASLSGSYALNLAGTNATSATAGNEEDLAGQLTTSGAATSQSGTVTAGSVDINNSASNLGATQTVSPEAGTFTVATSGNRATMTLTSPQNLVLYIVSPTQAFAMVGGNGNDTTGIVAIGSLFKQF
jgi:hypothetical protein